MPDNRDASANDSEARSDKTKGDKVAYLTKTEAQDRWAYEFKDHLIDASPEILWFYVDSDDDYQGAVWAVGVYKNMLVCFDGWYGSCSGCGAWGEGGEPESLEDVLNNSVLVSADWQSLSNMPTRFKAAAKESAMGEAISEAIAWVKKRA